MLHSFTLHTPGRVFHFSADSAELMVEWMAALKHVISTAIPKNRRGSKNNVRHTVLAMATNLMTTVYLMVSVTMMLIIIDDEW